MDVPIEAFWTGFMSKAAMCAVFLSICLMAFCAVFAQFADRRLQR